MPAKLGKYEIRKEVGRGSMGAVFEAYDLYIDRLVAVKVALADALKDEESGVRFRKMFFNEAHTVGCCDIRASWIYSMPGWMRIQCYIVMELVHDGTTLKEHCRAENLFSIN